ncbi:unnamed protein product [Schistosoma margrebowiei]|uniref:Uncharacterized protein n=1 Tax=Schistosoma margrebowiei TaxID=48269 RepID=A0A3P8F253_9TREM|nr:unnamed protein product [Schistosoma margrebowiei]
MGFVSWMYLHLRVDVHSGTGTHYHSLRTPSRYPLKTNRASWIPLLATIHHCLQKAYELR